MLRGKACLVFSVALAAAADVSWQSKPISQWSEKEARQVLVSSPWVKRAAASLMFQPSEDQLRAGGNMGGGAKGVGFESFELTNLVGGGKRRSYSAARGPSNLVVRWESASPVHAAEEKLRDPAAPEWNGEYYAVAIYGVPAEACRLDEPGREGDLKRTAFLKSEGNKDLRAVKVEITPTGAGLATVLYLFARTRSITPDEKRIEFAAQLGRVFVAQRFYPQEMRFQGKLEL